MILRTTTILAALVLTGTVTLGLTARGPYHFTIPVVGLTAELLPNVRDTLQGEFGREILEVAAKDGVLEFYAGGEGPKSLLHLGELTATIKKAGLRVDRDGWHLKAQELGICLSTPEAISQVELQKTLESLECVKIEVLGSLLCGSRLCLVLELEAGIDYTALRDELRVKHLEIDDLVWGHWKYGWSIEGEDGGHGHDMGMIARKGGKAQ